MHLVASDFDGTLLIDGTVDEAVIEEIIRFRAENNLFVICTGRPISSVMEQLLKYNIPYDYVIGVNGAVAIDQAGNAIFTHALDVTAVDEIARILRKHDVNEYFLSNGFDQVVIHGDETIDHHSVYDAVRAYYINTPDSNVAVGLVDEVNQEVNQFGIRAYPNNHYVAIGMTGIHKGYAVQKLKEILEWSGYVHVVGDDYNDIPMFKRFNSFGISTGVPAAISVADHTVDSVKEMLIQIQK